MLIGITEENKIRRLNENLEKSLNNFCDNKRKLFISSRRAKNEKVELFNVSYSSKLGIWWYFGQTRNRYWNCFGTDNIVDNKYLNITVEINVPITGKNFRVSGIWAMDSHNNYYLLHDGGIGGGSKGIGKELFVDNFSGDYVDVQVDGNIKNFAFVAQLNSNDVAYQLSWFVKENRKIKDLLKLRKNSKESIRKFTPEFSGTKTYTLPEKVTANCNHGIIVNKLREILEDKNLNIGKNKKIDLYTYSKDKINRIFEIKSEISRQSVYTAIGQLYLNSFELNCNPELIFICPNTIPIPIKKSLKQIGIKVITYLWYDNEPKFEKFEI